MVNYATEFAASYGRGNGSIETRPSTFAPEEMEDPPENREMGEREMGEMETEIYLQMALYTDEADDSVEVKRKKRMARTALTMWSESGLSAKVQRDQCDPNIRSTKNEIYQLIGLFSVFAGVILTAVTTSSRLTCQHLWSPIALSLLPYSMLVVDTFAKFRIILSLEHKAAFLGFAMRDSSMWVMKLKRIGYANFDFDSLRAPTQRRIRVSIWRSFLLLIVSLTVFVAALVFSAVHVLCWT